MENPVPGDVADSGQVVLCGFYHRYWNPDKTRNQAFDMFSGRILAVKEKKERGIAYFFQQLDEEECISISTSLESQGICPLDLSVRKYQKAGDE